MADATALQDQGVGSIAIMPNNTSAHPADSFKNMVQFSATHKVTFPCVIDEIQAVARAYDAAYTPEFFWYDEAFGLQYRGRLDASRMEPTSNVRCDLLEAMYLIATTGKGPVEQVPSMGSSIKWR